MKILCLDIASKTGFAVFNYNFNEDFELTLINKGVFDMSKASPLHKRYKPGLEHPLDFINFIDAQMDPIEAFILKERPNIIVVEQTNKGRDRWRQKLLEWMHRELIWRIMSINENDNAIPLKEDGSIDEIKLYYLDTMEWRNILGIRVGKEERKSNKSARKLRAELKERKAAGEVQYFCKGAAKDS